MKFTDDPFSMSSMFNALPHLESAAGEETSNYPRGISSSIPPPGFNPRASHTQLNASSLYNLMTSSECLANFKKMISKLDKTELRRMALSLTSDSNYFMEIVRNKYGSRRVQKLLGKSDDVDAILCAAILPRFLHIMTDKYASYVATRAMVVFEREKKKAMYRSLLHYALDLAHDQHGCIALNDILTDADDPYFRDQLLDLVARNALCLSNDASGNFVVQHVLKLHYLHYTHYIAVNLFGHCVDLSFKKYGSYIVEKLLEAEESREVVVVELLECQENKLMRLARSEFGNFVVATALRLTKEMCRFDQFWGLVQKLMPSLHTLRRSHGNNIANMLESYKLRC